MVPSKVKLGVIHPAVQSGPSVSVHKVPSVNNAVQSGPSVSVHKVPSVNSGTSSTQSVPSGTVHIDPEASPTVQPVSSDSVHTASNSTYPGVHVLDHGPENKTNRTERLAYLREQLALNESVNK